MNEHDFQISKRPEARSLLLAEALRPGGEVVEAPLLLSVQQLAALEEAAHHRGLTVGEMVRRLLFDALAGLAANAPLPSKKSPFAAERKEGGQWPGP